MKINLAVYTATQGYAWQPGSVYSTDELSRFKLALGTFPSVDGGEFPKKGRIAIEDKVLFYQFSVARHFDFRGRDALYCVVAAVSSEETVGIDEEELFATAEFSKPRNPVPTCVRIGGVVSAIRKAFQFLRK